MREYQSSIKESVKTLLEDKIAQFGQEHEFEVTESEIRRPANGSLIVFKGLHDYVSKPGGGPAAGIKSLEGFTQAWVEEAQTISKRSLDILTPTFRGRPTSPVKPEMWFTWNPGRETDPIEQFFNDNEGDPDFICVHSTFADNPWFEASGLRRDMERDRARDPAKYAHVWLGQYLSRSEAQVFSNWRVEEFETPDDARLFYGADWGFANDPTTLVRCWVRGHDLFVDHEAYAVGCKIEQTAALFLTVPGAKNWRIRADSARPETIDYMRDRGFKIVPAIKGKNSVEDGIEFLKTYDITIHPRCQYTIGEFITYSWKVDPRTDEVLPQLVDRNNHCIAEGTLVSCKNGLVPIEQVRVGDCVFTRSGYKPVLAAWQAGDDREVVLVSTTVGQVRCTPDHKIWTSKGWSSADALRYDDEVVGQNLIYGYMRTVTDGGRSRVYDLTVAGQHEFFAGGVLVSNCIDALRYALEEERNGARPLIASPELLRRLASTPTRNRFATVQRDRFARAR